MEMCYDGTLVMPSRYVVMDNDEMTYVEGGAIRRIARFDAIQCNRMAALVCIFGGLITVVAGIATVISAVATIASCGTSAAIIAICAGITAAAAGITASISGYLWYASTYKGLDVNYNTSTRGISIKVRKK